MYLGQLNHVKVVHAFGLQHDVKDRTKNFLCLYSVCSLAIKCTHNHIPKCKHNGFYTLAQYKEQFTMPSNSQ